MNNCLTVPEKGVDGISVSRSKCGSLGYPGVCSFHPGPIVNKRKLTTARLTDNFLVPW